MHKEFNNTDIRAKAKIELDTNDFTFSRKKKKCVKIYKVKSKFSQGEIKKTRKKNAFAIITKIFSRCPRINEFGKQKK